jgi:2-aminoadipate transaminase
MSELFRLSAIAHRMQPSPIRELFGMIQQPGMISFAGGFPDPSAFPVAEFAACAEVLERDGREVLQYGASEGYGPLREALIEIMRDRLGYAVAPEELLITSGSQQAVDLIARALLDPGDIVVVEAPTYPGTVHCLRNAGARFACVPCDSDGMRVEELADVVDRCDRKPKLIYTVPDFSNPSGACMSLDRRYRLLELTEQLGIPVFEDDPYGRLRYEGEPIPTLKRLAGDSPLVVYASSFSKVLAPGVRVAWTVASPDIVRTMVLMRQGEDLCTSTVTQALVAEYCGRGLLERHLKKILEVYTSKCRSMQRGLDAHVPRELAQWHEPRGGFFFWLRLPGLDSSQVFRRAVEEKVAFVPGPAFYPGGDEQVGPVRRGDEFARLAFTFADDAQIDEGCRRLGRVLAH